MVTATCRGSKTKCLFVTLFLIFTWFWNNAVLAYVHDFVPEGPPLPDFWFAIVPLNTNILRFGEYCIVTCVAMMFLVMAVHPQRWLVTSRVFYILSLLYLGRSFTFSVTLLPLPNNYQKCAPKLNNTSLAELWDRCWRVVAGAGLEVAGLRNTCGDLIYSGHTIALLVACLTVREYAPKRLQTPMSIVAYVLACVGLVAIVTSRLHYTIDVAIAYYFVTRTFWSYHVSVNLLNASEHEEYGDWLSKLFWFPALRYIEGGSVLSPTVLNGHLPTDIRYSKLRDLEAAMA